MRLHGDAGEAIARRHRWSSLSFDATRRRAERARGLAATSPGVGAIALGPESVLLTVIITLLTVNAINFIDGLDGLAAGVGAIAALALFAFSYSLASGVLTGGLAQDRITSPTLIAVVLA
ncbi:MAG: hypothetical protein KY442_09690, partial [Proteobacteria bacterium]|nr:hypothetical protein [Pseudomonadota bacterium]